MFCRKTDVSVLTFYTEFGSTIQSIIYYCGIDVQFSRRWRPQIPKGTQNRPFSQKSGARVFSFKQSLVQDLNQWLILLLCHLVFNFLRNDGHRFQKTPKTGCFPKDWCPSSHFLHGICVNRSINNLILWGRCSIFSEMTAIDSKRHPKPSVFPKVWCPSFHFF